MACWRIASLEAELVHLEDGFARSRADGAVPDPATVDLYQRISNTQRRLCESIGWRREAREIAVPTLGEYLASKSTPPPIGRPPRVEAAGDAMKGADISQNPIFDSKSESQ
jgi:hypothetical protein